MKSRIRPAHDAKLHMLARTLISHKRGTMEYEFKKVMSQRTDKELIKIVTTERGDYRPEAIEAAESEIEQRKIDVKFFEEIKEKATIEKINKKQVDSNEAGLTSRFLNFLVDSIVWFVLAFISSYIIVPLILLTNERLLGFMVSIWFIAIFIVYYAIMEIKWQKTVGKFVTKTRVVNLNGEIPDKSDIISRTFCRLIPFDRVSFLFAKNGIHDFLSSTKVVNEKKQVNTNANNEDKQKSH